MRPLNYQGREGRCGSPVPTAPARSTMLVCRPPPEAGTRRSGPPDVVAGLSGAPLARTSLGATPPASTAREQRHEAARPAQWPTVVKLMRVQPWSL
jgi:hypothetical protein